MKDLSTVNGLKVETREQATMASHLQGGKTVKATTVDAVLLENGTVVFQCVHPNAPDCEYTADNVTSVTAHQRSHGDKVTAHQLRKELATANAELEARKERRSVGSRNAAVTRKRNRELQTTAPAVSGTPVANTSTELTKAIARVQITSDAVNDALEQHATAIVNLVRVANSIPAADPQIIVKAQQYDAMKAALSAMNTL